MTGRINTLLFMLCAAAAAVAVSGSAASASTPLPPPTGHAAPRIVIPGPGDPPPPTPGPVRRSAVVVTVAFKGGYSTPASTPDQTAAAVGARITDALNPWLAKVSRGRFLGYTRGTTHQYVVVQPKAQLCTDAWVQEVTDQAKAAERKMGTNPDDYDAVVYYFKAVSACSWLGKADYPEHGNRVLLNGTTALAVMAHEFGHHLGLGHAGSQSCVDSFGHPVPLYLPVEARCSQDEAGDAWTAMGSRSPGFPTTYAAKQLNQLGWDVGTETISAGDPTVTRTLPRLEDDVPGSTQALRLVDGTTVLWVEYHQTPSRALASGLIVRAEEPSLATPRALHVAPFLLDMTPGSDSTAAELPVGRAWTNPQGTMTVTLNSADRFNARVTIQSTPGPLADPDPTAVTVPDVTGQSVASATSELTRDGLVRGAVRTIVNCEDIGRVVSQSPVAGVHLPLGGTVDIIQGVPPRGGCGIPQ